MTFYWLLLRRDKAALGSVVFLVLLTLSVVLGWFFLRSGAQTLDFETSLKPPFSGGFHGLLGTDQLGRSMAARLVVGGAISLVIAVTSALLAALIGGVVGIVAGYRRGAFDAVAMRSADVILSFPMLLLALLFLYVLKPQPSNIVILLVIARLPLYVRVARAETVELRRRLFVDASRCLGASGARICAGDIAPMVVPTLLTLVTLDIGTLILLESSLSFLGLGIQAPSFSWGTLVSEGRDFVGTAWWLSFFPGLAIFLTALASNLFGNWLRLATDPTQRWRLELPRKRLALPPLVAPQVVELVESEPLNSLAR